MSEQPSTRDSIISLIDENPGIHFREIQRRTGLAVGQVEYHLYQLEKEEKISIREDGNIKRYFSISSDNYAERQLLFYLRSSSGRDVLQKLADTDYVPLHSLLRVRKSKLKQRKKIIDDMKKDGIIEVFDQLGLDQVKIKDRSKLLEVARRYRESYMEILSENFISILDDEY